MMNLVTGGAGLLGSHIVEQLLARDEPVRVLVRSDAPLGLPHERKVQKVLGDLTDPASLAAAMKDVRTVYHAAAQVGDWGTWEAFRAVTIRGTANMLRAAREAGVRRFLHVSSISTYGHPNVKGMVLDERAPLGANLHRWSYYSRAKIEAERLVRAAHDQGELPVTIVKPSWLYGPRDRATLPRLIRAIRAGKAKIVGDGQNRLNLTYAGNEAEGCILAATSDKAVGQTYNLADDGVITLEQFFNTIAAQLGAPPVKRKVPYKIAYGAGFFMEVLGHALRRKRPPLVTRYSVWLMGRRCFFSSEKARRELAWRPTVGYEEGIQRSVQWFLEREREGS